MLSAPNLQYIVVKGAGVIDEKQPTGDNKRDGEGNKNDKHIKPETSGFIIEHIVPVLTEGEKIKVKQEINDGLFRVFRKYY